MPRALGPEAAVRKDSASATGDDASIRSMRVPGLHASADRQDVQRPAAQASREPGEIDDYGIDWPAVRAADRSCCCPAAPAVVAVLPPRPGREHRTEILLCMHHFRQARGALSAAGATVYRRTGEPLGASEPAYLSAG